MPGERFPYIPHKQHMQASDGRPLSMRRRRSVETLLLLALRFDESKFPKAAAYWLDFPEPPTQTYSVVVRLTVRPLNWIFSGYNYSNGIVFVGLRRSDSFTTLPLSERNAPCKSHHVAAS
jgi:hypothetical protein